MNMTPVSLGDIPDTLQELESTYIIKFDNFTKEQLYFWVFQVEVHFTYPCITSKKNCLAMINWSGEQEYYSMYYSCGKIFQKILNIQDELKRSYTTCSHPMDISSHLAETVFFSYLFMTNRLGKGFLT